MSRDMDAWNVRNELLNALESAIEQKTCGRLSSLSMEVVDGQLVVEACSRTYYAIQLTLAAIRRFAIEFPHMRPSRLNVCVDGHSFVLRDPYGTPSKGQPTARVKSAFLSERLFSDLHDYEPSSSTGPQPVVAAGAR